MAFILWKNIIILLYYNFPKYIMQNENIQINGVYTKKNESKKLRQNKQKDRKENKDRKRDQGSL